jgi:hypothetical protein
MARAVKEVKEVIQPVVRNSAGLRDVIFDEIDAIRSGKSNPTRANAVAKLASTVVETVRMEIEVQRHLRNSPPVGEEAGIAVGAPIALGKMDRVD